MDKELEEAIKALNAYINAIDTFGTIDYKCINNLYRPVKTVLTALENSIPKQVIEEYFKIEQERFNVYKKESKENENLKMGMWKHLGAKNMCERILGIEKTVTLD